MKAVLDSISYRIYVSDAPWVESPRGTIRPTCLDVTVTETYGAWVRIEGRAIKVDGVESHVARGAGYDLVATPASQRRLQPPPSWVLDLLDTIPSLALISAQAREAA